MEDTFECPNCDEEGAYFNRVTYECPNCDEEWECDLIEDFEEY